MSNLWFFGDSFCANQANWTEKTMKKYSYDKILNFGSSGTGILFSIQELLNKFKQIKSDDGVVFCISQPDRQTYNHKPFGVDILTTNADYYKNRYEVSQDEIEAFRIFYKTLHTEGESSFRSLCMVNTLIDKILPSLPTNKICILFSFSDYQSSNLNFIDYDFKTFPSLHELKNRYIYQYLNLNDDDAIRLGKNPNHWPEHDYWDDLFFPTYKPLLDKLK